MRGTDTCSSGVSCGKRNMPIRYRPQSTHSAIQRPSTKSKVKRFGDAAVWISSAVRKNLNAAANSRKPITTFTELSQDPLLGSLRNKAGNNARKKNGDAKVAANAKPPSK